MSEGFGRQIFRAPGWRDTSSAVRPFSNQVGNRFVICCETQITAPIVLQRDSRLSPSRKLNLQNAEHPALWARSHWSSKMYSSTSDLHSSLESHNIICCVNLSIISCAVCRCAGVCTLRNSASGTSKFCDRRTLAGSLSVGQRHSSCAD